jgi:hypothetical protein
MELIGLALCVMGIAFCLVFMLAKGLDKIAEMIARDFKGK